MNEMTTPFDFDLSKRVNQTKTEEVSSEESLRQHVVKAAQVKGYNTQDINPVWFSLSQASEIKKRIL
ncbi:hypothetical protein LNL84_05870 [Vibrio sp. ZSDZ34]|jgi:hypothetical protein|uniref:Uncharacterized protein n=1 Tax=Vibrio gelatinilyticus TaxID=2893468 RepID=A0A9X2AUY0_9VIBR|nr:hypothetical protein [Vibrio gelatinilyticus]MCJ2376359.1 hypothetical protein [Vibrio gelatinilyticus]